MIISDYLLTECCLTEFLVVDRQYVIGDRKLQAAPSSRLVNRQSRSIRVT